MVEAEQGQYTQQALDQAFDRAVAFTSALEVTLKTKVDEVHCLCPGVCRID